MQLILFVSLLFVAAAGCAEEVSNVVQPAPVVSQVVPAHSVVEQPQPQAHGVHVHQPAVGAYPVGEQQHYAPAGVIQVVGGAPGPQQYSSEQYGKPESASIPPNYKPFGSWGLYIGGNPADGYYSSYYKALGNSVDKQQVSGVEQAAGFKPVSSSVGGSSSSGASQASAFNPILKQASGSYPYGTYDQVYPFDYYTQADLNSAPSVYSAGPISSPVQVGSQVYGVPVSSYGSEQPALVYADTYSTKRIGSSASKSPERSHSIQQQQQQQQVEATPAKGYQTRFGYAHSPVVQAAAPVVSQQQHHYSAQPQVVAYPVPVGSQIVGSQPGTEGAYVPYGVHGYTRYAVKPTVVSSSEQHYHGVQSAPVSHFPVYKQQVVQPVAAYQPLSFYGYPLNQLHYSQGSLVPAFGHQGSSSSVQSGSPVSVSGNQQQVGVSQVGPVASPHGAVGVHEQVGPQVGGGPMMSPVGPQVEAASSEKSETHSAVGDSKPKEQKRA